MKYALHTLIRSFPVLFFKLPKKRFSISWGFLFNDSAVKSRFLSTTTLKFKISDVSLIMLPFIKRLGKSDFFEFICITLHYWTEKSNLTAI